jgi:nucleoside 2-deoxyribosyltransferase
MLSGMTAGSPRPSIYLAGPGGFDAGGRAWHRLVRDRLDAAGFAVLDPWVASQDVFDAAFAEPDGERRQAALAAANRTAGARNADMVRAADAVFALLDGVDVDSGTAAEIGYAAAVGTPVVGYRTDWRTSGDNEAAVVNLQVESFIAESGGVIVLALDATEDDVTLLDRAVAELRRRFA